MGFVQDRVYERDGGGSVINPRAKHKRHYKVRNLTGLHKFEVDLVGPALDAIRERDGGIRPSVVVEEARADESPLHAPFEWDDEVASEQYRLWQARKLVRNVVPVIYERSADTGERVEREIPFVHVPAKGDEPSQYRDLDSLATDTDAFARAFDSAMQKLRVAQRSVAELEGLVARSPQPERLDVIRVALRGLETAQTALERLH